MTAADFWFAAILVGEFAKSPKRYIDPCMSAPSAKPKQPSFKFMFAFNISLLTVSLKCLSGVVPPHSAAYLRLAISPLLGVAVFPGNSGLTRSDVGGKTLDIVTFDGEVAGRSMCEVSWGASPSLLGCCTGVDVPDGASVFVLGADGSGACNFAA